jgi:hypothetical protein
VQLWSERPGARIREVAADVATLAWLAFWGQLGIGIYAFLANAAAAGRLIRDSGSGLDGAGETLGGALQGIPLIGEGSASGVRGAFSSAADPLIRFGIDLERLLVVIAALFGLLVVAVAVIPWLNRYLPWRVARWRRLNAGTRVIRRPRQSAGRPLSTPALQRILASRALHRLEYDELLEFSPDPFGDWDAGRHDRLAEAELDRVGLRAATRAGGA